MTPSFLLGLAKRSHTQGRYDEAEVYAELGIKKFPLFLNDSGVSFFLEEKVSILIDKRKITEACKYVENCKDKEWFYKICFYAALDTRDTLYRDELMELIPTSSNYKLETNYCENVSDNLEEDTIKRYIDDIDRIKMLFLKYEIDEAFEHLKALIDSREC